MADLNDQFNKILAQISDVMSDFSDDMESKLRAAIKKRKLEDSGDLLSSLKSQVSDQSEGVFTELRLRFNKYGRFRELRNVRTGGKQIPVEGVLEKWVERNIGLFKYVPGYKNDRRNLADIPNAYKRIAFAVAKKRQTGGKHRAWYIKNTFEIIYGTDGLIDQILDKLTNEDILLFQSMQRDIKLLSTN